FAWLRRRRSIGTLLQWGLADEPAPLGRPMLVSSEGASRMSQPDRPAGEAERQAFARQLGQFRTTLPANEQRMLDSLVLAAEGAQRGTEVQGYAAILGTDASTAQW